MEYYSVLKRKEILTPATAWMILEDMILSEISRTQKTNTVCSHSQEVPRGVTSTETRSIWWGQGLGEGLGSQCFLETRVSVWGDGKVLEMDSGNFCTTM